VRSFRQVEKQDAKNQIDGQRLHALKPVRFAVHYRREPVDALTPEKVFAARWALALLGEAMNRLRQEYATREEIATVEALKAFLDLENSQDPPSYEQAAASLRVSVGAVKSLIYRLRKYAALVREEIDRTVSDPAEVGAEIHELCEALMVAEGWVVP
jgi:hypothetical protein